MSTNELAGVITIAIIYYIKNFQPWTANVFFSFYQQRILQ